MVCLFVSNSFDVFPVDPSRIFSSFPTTCFPSTMRSWLAGIALFFLAQGFARAVAGGVRRGRLEYAFSSPPTAADNLARYLGTVELRNDEATFVEVVSSCSSMDMYHCPLAGFVSVGTRGGDVLLLSREGALALEVAGPPGSGAVRVIRLVQSKSHQLQHDVLLVASYEGIPGLLGLLVNHMTMDVDSRGWLTLLDTVHDVQDVRIVESTVSSGPSGQASGRRMVLPSVAVLDSLGRAYVGLDVVVGAEGDVRWSLDLIGRNITHIFASYKFGIFVVARDGGALGDSSASLVARVDRRTLALQPLPCLKRAQEQVAFDDTFHEVYASSVEDTASPTLRRLRVAPGECREVHTLPLLKALHQTSHISTSGGFSLVSGNTKHGSGISVLYNHSMQLVEERGAPWNVGRFVSLVMSEDDLPGRTPFLARMVGFLGSFWSHKSTFEARLAVWGQFSFLYRNTMVVVSSGRRRLLLYRPTFRAVIGKVGAARSKELTSIVMGILKSVGLIGAGVFGLALSRTTKGRVHGSSPGTLDEQIASVYAEYKRERDSTREGARRKIPVDVDPFRRRGEGLRQHAVDFAPDPDTWFLA